ncbi:hypothetical protein [Hespellia stercorisuis]|uniref:Uncharacterized protein n=1 Tax=Hespellia stercorisuis DSM 15480 TaxID=1121950 RepID=A0A1M6T5M1_9FIRM|nr:hypothetical protein [Hespellia stercorisuis]SHK52253.1 hypothetical protein SAMN02745243_03137 [Hespellia stercorisuis DSM 15480]
MNKIKEWLKSHTKQAIAIATAIVLIIAFAVAGVTGAFSKNTEPETETSASETTTESETQETIIDEIKLNVTSPDEKWTAESSPAIVHIVGTDDNTKSTDFYHAISYGKEEPKISLVSGEYELTVVAPINVDGSIHVLANANKDADKDGTKETLTFNSADYVTKDKASEQLLVEITIKQIPAEQVTDEMMKEVVDNIKTAIKDGDDTLKGDNGKQILDTVNKNVDANEHISDETKESTKETTESAQSETETKPAETVKPDNTGNTDNTSTGTDNGSTGNTGNGSGNSGGNTGGTKPDTGKPKEPVWVPDQGHYEKVWVENMVLVEIAPAKTEKVYDYSDFYFTEDGYTTTSEADCINHQMELAMQGYSGSFQQKDHYKTVTTPAVTEWQDQGKYEDKWVVDVPGHWE